MLALKSKKMAYAPYSGYKVGAALLAKNGAVFTGCNIENASFGATVCAERTAIFKAASEGVTEFEKLAVVGGKGEAVSDRFPPCGICRQVLREFCDDGFRIIFGSDRGVEGVYTLHQLLPESFAPDSLK